MLKVIRLHRARRQLARLHQDFRDEPHVQLVSNLAAVYCDDESKRQIAISTREGCLGALAEMGLDGPWADQERRSLAIGAMRSLLTGVLDDDVLDAAFEGLS